MTIYDIITAGIEETSTPGEYKLTETSVCEYGRDWDGNVAGYIENLEQYDEDTWKVTALEDSGVTIHIDGAALDGESYTLVQTPDGMQLYWAKNACEYAVNSNNGEDGWDDSDQADWYSTWSEAYDAGYNAIREPGVEEAMVATYVDGEIEDQPLYLRNEDDEIHEYRNGERCWAL